MTASGNNKILIEVAVKDASAGALKTVDRNLEGVGTAAKKAATEATTALGRVDRALQTTGQKMSGLGSDMNRANAAMTAPLDKFAAQGAQAGQKFAAGMQAGVKEASMVAPMNRTGQAATVAAGQHGQRAGREFGSKMMAGFMGVGIAGLISKQISSAVNAYTQMAVDVNKLKRTTGGDTESASHLRTQLQLSGVDATKSDTALRIFSKNLGTAAQDAKKMATMTGLLGFSFTDAAGKVAPLTDILPSLSDRFKEMPNGAEKTALAMKLFGKSGADMLPFLGKGSEALADLSAKSDEFGLTVNDQALTAMGNAKGQAREFSAAIQGLTIQFGAGLLPAMTAVRKMTTEYLIPALQTAAEFVKKNNDWIVPLIVTLTTLFATVKLGSTIIAGFGKVLDTIAKNPFILVIVGLVALGVALKQAYDKVDWFHQMVDRVWDKIQDKFGGAWDAITKVLTAMKDGLVVAGEGLIDMLSAMAGWIEPILDFFIRWFDPISKVALALGAVLLLNGPLVAFFTMIKVNAVTAFQLMAVGLRSAMGAVIGFGKALWTAIGGPIGAAIIGVTTALAFLTDGQDEATQVTTDFTSAIDANTGALLENAPAIIAKSLADSGHLKTLKESGLEQGLYIRAVMGEAGALDSARQSLIQHGIEIAKTNGHYEEIQATARTMGMTEELLVATWIASGQAIGGLGEGMQPLIDTYQNLGSDAGTLAEQQQLVNDVNSAAASAAGPAASAQADLNETLQEGIDPTTGMADALKEMQGAASDADTAAQFLFLTLQQAQGVTITTEQMTRANAAAFRDLASSAREVGDKQKELDNLTNHLGTTLDGEAVSSTNLAVTQRDVDEAASALASAQDGLFNSGVKVTESAAQMASQAYLTAVQQGNLTGAVSAAVQVMQQQRDQFIAGQVAAGMEKDAAALLADQMGLIPGTVQTTYEAQNLQAQQAQVADLNAQLDAMKDKTVRYYLVGSSTVKVTADEASAANAKAANFGYAPYNYEGLTPTKAAGGMVTGPGTGTSDSVPILASNGEFVSTAKATAEHRSELEAFNRGYARGGIVSVGGSHVGGAVPGGLVIGDVNTFGVPDVGKLASAWSYTPPAPVGGGVPGASTAGVEQWRAIMTQALQMTGQYTAANVAAGLNQMRTESSGNQAAINLTDSNAKKGIPSKGLMQVIDPTFRSYAMPGYNSNIYDPLSNILASIRYVLARYGSVAAGWRGVAYDNGGIMASGTMGMNMSGRDERVLSPSETAEWNRKGSDRGSSKTVNVQAGAVQITVSGNVDARARAEMRAELEAALRDILSEDADRRM